MRVCKRPRNVSRSEADEVEMDAPEDVEGSVEPTPSSPAQQPQTEEAGEKDPAATQPARRPSARTSRIASSSASDPHKTRGAWNRGQAGPLFTPGSIKVATPSPWPLDGIPVPLGFRPSKESNVGRLQTDARKSNFASVVEQVREMQDMEWYPGKVFDPRRLRGMVRRADGDALEEEQEQEGAGSADDGQGFAIPFQHPNLDVKAYELLDEESANAFLASGPAGSQSSAAARNLPAVQGSSSSQPTDKTDPPRPSQGSTDTATLLSRLSGTERFIAGFKEVGPRNDADQGGARVFMGVPEPKQEVLIPRLGSADVPGTGRGQAKEKVHVLNAGGVVYDLAWRPVPPVLAHGPEYLVVSAAEGIDVRTPLGSTCPSGTPGTLQVWSLNPVSADPHQSTTPSDPKGKGKAVEKDLEKEAEADSTVALQMVIHHEYGTAMAVEWCPNGHDFRSKRGDDKDRPLRRLGLLAGVFHDGTIRILSVPHPDDVRAAAAASGQATASDKPLRVRLQAVLTLTAPRAVPSCLCWAGGELLAAGFSDGHVGVWQTGELLRSGSPTAYPSHFIFFQEGYITSVAWSLIPYQDASGVYHPESPFLPHVLFTTNTDGANGILDLHDPFMGWGPDAQRGRTPLSKIIWSPQIERFVCDAGDGTVRLMTHRYGTLGAMRRIANARGRILTLATSPQHAFLAYGSADGCLRITNIVRTILGPRGTANQPKPNTQAVAKAFRLDHDRSNGKLRFVDNFLPEFAAKLQEDGSRRGGLKMKHNAFHETTAFHPSIAVRTAAWNPNLGRGHLIASGTGVGIVRIDRFEVGSVKMTGKVLAPAIVAQRKARAQMTAHTAGLSVGPSESEGQIQEATRPVLFDDLKDDAGSVPFSTVDAQIGLDASADRETTFEVYVHQAFLEGMRISSLDDPDAAGTPPSAPKPPKALPKPKPVKEPKVPQEKKVKEDGPPKKRGRPRKHPLPEDGPSTAADGSGEIPKKKIGRPRKYPLPEDGPSTAAAGSGETPKKRGRPRKNPLPEDATGSGETQEQKEEGPPKKRGRPRKNPLPEDGPSTAAAGSGETPKKRGRPRKNPLPEDATGSGETEEQKEKGPPKKRGRPRKNPLPEDGPSTAAAGSGETPKKRGRPRKNPLPEDASPEAGDAEEQDQISTATAAMEDSDAEGSIASSGKGAPSSSVSVSGVRWTASASGGLDAEGGNADDEEEYEEEEEEEEDELSSQSAELTDLSDEETL
ncbi:hypothetical protein CF336_g5332 [Tilletia laevis]|uniref:Transcription factor TFIIIC triple barrel domain-containing protein n=1 Tax=Tilletia caries TaxID=13290 RepID=A0ABN7J5W3_9BASI|nr:hypothetical protein CF336_g5332 [Tilletia laevis]KAE8196662.1 hypothetical protein CF335_g4801 [Tilletia laevis]CAD6948078.1 unnamed protein product [Tilletia caries]CAD7059619.1 unnamed protein product [Tilletia caries]